MTGSDSDWSFIYYIATFEAVALFGGVIATFQWSMFLFLLK